MTPQHQHAVPQFGRVRRSIWGLLAAALLLALALPLVALWHAAASPLEAEVCLWPPVPQAHGTAQVVVTLPDKSDRAAVAGSWAHLAVAWDMATMPMGTQPVVLSGTAAQAGTFAVPLRVDMGGPWWVDLTLSTPGRPDWHTHFQFTVASSQALVQTLHVQESGVSPCRTPEG